jgi:HD superfamily phosphohydrolase
MFVYDPIHGEIEISEYSKKIIDTPEFQRLRNIKQGGAVYSVWIGSSHHRFEHSIGVMHLARKLMNLINEKGDYINERQYKLIEVAALIHDLGHGVSSHLFDDWLSENGIYSEHEERSIEIFEMMNDKYNLGYNEYDIIFIGNIINPNYDILDLSTKFLYQIVSSENGIDVDRMDYILRDCKYSGMKYSFELDTILKNTFISESGDIVYSEKARCTIDSFFSSRYSLYKQLCNHPTVLAIEYHIKEILNVIDPIFNISKSVVNGDWDTFCKFTDDIFSTIDFIDDSKLILAKELLNNIKTRNILKFVGGIITDKNTDIISENKDVVIIKKKISYHSYSLPKYISNNKNKTLTQSLKFPDEYIIKIMCKDTNNKYALSLLDKLE